MRAELSGNRVAWGILCLRLSLGMFLLQWAVEKIILPSATVRIAAGFYGIGLPENLAPLLGIAEAALSLALLAGFLRRPVYGAALAIHAVTTIVSWRQLLDPYGLAKIGNHLFIASEPVLGGFIALYLLREFDALSLDGWLQARRMRLATSLSSS